MRPFNINDNKEDTEGIKKWLWLRLLIIINVNLSKKEKIKLVKKLFVNNDNKNKVNDEKEEIEKYFFYKCLLILKQWLMRKN